MQNHIKTTPERLPRRLRKSLQNPTTLVMRAVLGLSIGLSAIAPGGGLAVGRDSEGHTTLSPACRDGLTQDSQGNPCPKSVSLQVSISGAKWAAAEAYHRFLSGNGTREEVEAADRRLSAMTRENIGANDWSVPGQTPAAYKLRGTAAAQDYGPLFSKFHPFEQITWWYCGPATAQSILWYLGPHRSESYDEVWGGRPWLTGRPEDDQWLLANDFWLATNKYEGTNWGEAYMPHTLNAWRGTFWYMQSATPQIGGSLTKEEAVMALRYDFDRSYPVAENVLYAPATYYPYGFWPGVIYQHWDVLHGYVVDGATGDGYVKVGQVYHDERIPYQRFQQVQWDVHWGAIANWHGIVW